MYVYIYIYVSADVYNYLPVYSICVRTIIYLYIVYIYIIYVYISYIYISIVVNPGLVFWDEIQKIHPSATLVEKRTPIHRYCNFVDSPEALKPCHDMYFLWLSLGHA